MPPSALALIHRSAGEPWTVVSWVALAVAFTSAATIAWDIFARGYRQHMAIMDAVYPVTALYWGPVAAWFYFKRGKRMSEKWAAQQGINTRDLMSEEGRAHRRTGRSPKRHWWPIAKVTAHCGAGCTLGDICGEWLVFITAWTIPIFGAHDADGLMTMYAADFAFAWLFGIVFQYFSIVPMRKDVGRLDEIWYAIKADTLSILAFQVGLFGYMALYHLVF